MVEGTHDFVKQKQAAVSPLASQLFNIDGVNRVFYGKDYISVSKMENVDWNLLKPKILEFITNHFDQE